MSARLTTDVELADMLGLTAPEVRRFCRERGWPCVRPKRTVWRFTDAHIDEIVRMQTVKPKRAAQIAATIPGQTARSARRSA